MKNKLIPSLQGPGSERRGRHRSCRRLLKLSLAGSLILSGLTLAGCKKQPAASNSVSNPASPAAQPASPSSANLRLLHPPPPNLRLLPPPPKLRLLRRLNPHP